jgi:hexosaminidase
MINRNSRVIDPKWNINSFELQKVDATSRMSKSRRIFFCFCLLIVAFTSAAQITIPQYPDSIFSTYYHQRVTLFKSLPQTKEDIIFVGNSITDGSEWSELFDDKKIKNRGISGDISVGVIHRIDEIVQRKPAKVFLLIGTNDLARGISADSVIKNVFWISSYIHEQTPSTELFVQSILPVNDVFKKFGDHVTKEEQIKNVNQQLRQQATINHFTYIDLHTAFSNDQGKLDSQYSNDGLHLTGTGYLLWKHLVYPYIFDLNQKSSLIPLPQQLKWTLGTFPLYNCTSIIVNDPTLQKEAERLQQNLAGHHLSVQIKPLTKDNEPVIELRLGKVDAPQFKEEAYQLSVTPKRIILTANSAHGIFNGLQILDQLMRDEVMVDACEITDWPAFEWRGLMVDVGRNFQSVEMLKQQIEVMAKYKLNIFHLHLTEDIGWRLAIKKYPQLTAPENMLRNKGQYYSERELKELIAFCKERYITLVPEIDMPGHSAAFTRAMKTTMQTDSGLMIVKDILKEICTTYDVPYIHIGADEVKIVNKEFVPAVTAYIESFGKQVIGWQPGGNFTDKTIRQLWMDDKGHLSKGSDIKYIDSRHLYLNHMDPLESVVTIFNRKIGDKEMGDKSMLGGTICVWPDRRVGKEEDILRMNPVYPAMLSFAERSWRGGGVEGWVANMGAPDTESAKKFEEFENRLMDHKQHYFSNLPFPYLRQSSIQWKLYGPYSNNGNLSEKFEPENIDFDTLKNKAAMKAVGGTIVLRHWWHPLIKGVIPDPSENTTWYALGKIWSDDDKEGKFWIGFNNLSRSPATNSPPVGSWDSKNSEVKVNGILIQAPEWNHGGQKGNSETPLVDEGYEYREPTNVTLKKGWNTVLVKLPIAGFKGTDWQNPVKWMFTFMPYDEN